MKSEARTGALKQVSTAFDVTSTLILIGALVAGSVAAAVYFCAGHNSLVLGWGIVASAILLIGGFVRPLLNLAARGYEGIWPTCVTSAFLTIFQLVCFYGAFLAFTDGKIDASHPIGKILELPPVIAAIWAAGTGWFVHLQLTNRNHRTANSVSVVMGTRTNAEFLKRQDLIRRYLPTQELADAIEERFFKKDALYKSRLALVENPEDVTAKSDMGFARAVEAVRYSLNYYEFMAVGIVLGDLDEKILYETISPAVVHLYKLAEKMRTWCNGTTINHGQQPLAFEHLDALVTKWNEALELEKIAKASSTR